MKASELVKKLRSLMDEHGDCRVVTGNDLMPVEDVTPELCSDMSNIGKLEFEVTRVFYLS